MSEGSAIAKALDYSLRRWDALTRYLDDRPRAYGATSSEFALLCPCHIICFDRKNRISKIYNWESVELSLYVRGYAVLPHILSAEQCEAMSSLYSQGHGYRARVVMARHGFGRGEYKYFSYPLPSLLERLRHEIYPRLAPIANGWNRQMGIDVMYPEDLTAFLQRCHCAGQVRPTPLILKYAEGDYNCLHQDIYGALVFPIQTAILLSAPGRDFEGGEFVMTERSSKGVRADVVELRQGDAVIFSVNQRPITSHRGVRKVATRHGVSRIRAGKRYTAGLIFHDAE